MEEEQISVDVGGETVRGVLHLPDETPAPLAIIVHGWSGEKTGPNRFFVTSARTFAEEGHAVARFDFRGSGDSDWKFKEQTHTSMLEDLDSVITALQNREEVGDTVMLIGHSQGGYISLLHTAEDDRVDQLVVWMGRTSDIEDWFSQPWKDELDRKGYYVHQDHKQTEVYYEDGLQFDLMERLPEIDVPVGMIYGEMDEVVPPAEGERVEENVAGPVEFEIM
ncbi:MAG: alpha/beta fold hydrolase, partial [Candidatus Nanohaloarchaea archaeon]|nr:alpha/beta fold hydrolase [Candidatus Nanohaloarchaea archaeon]